MWNAQVRRCSPASSGRNSLAADASLPDLRLRGGRLQLAGVGVEDEPRVDGVLHRMSPRGHELPVVVVERVDLLGRELRRRTEEPAESTAAGRTVPRPSDRRDRDIDMGCADTTGGIAV